MHGKELIQISCTKNLAEKILYYRRWYRRLCHFYKLRNNQRPLYLYSEIPQEHTFHHNLRRANIYEANAKSTDRFSHTYFQTCMREWNQLDECIKISPTVSVFKRELMSLIRPQKRSLFGFHDIEGVRLLTCLRVEFSDLREHRFRHTFQCSSPMCFYQTEIENNEHFLLHYPCHSGIRTKNLWTKTPRHKPPDKTPWTKTPLPKTPQTKTPQRKLMNTKYILHK